MLLPLDEGLRLNDDESGAPVLLEPATDEWRRIWHLMRQYQDVPMDIADASLVTAAERLEKHRIFTLDSHFYAYRINGAENFEVIPR